MEFYQKKKSKKDAIGLKFLQVDGKTIANSLLYLYSYVFDNGDKKRDFIKLNIPILHGFYYRNGDQNKWEKDNIGIPLGSIAGGYIMPETLGFTDSMIIATQNKSTKKFETIHYQLDAFISKAFKLSKLQTLENKDKKVALLYYALGRDKIGASFLNIPQSIESILKSLNKKVIQVKIYQKTIYEKRL